MKIKKQPKYRSLPLSALFGVLLCFFWLTTARGENKVEEITPSITEFQSAGYKLAFHDEFDGQNLDLSKWIYRKDSKHWSTQLPENVQVKDGVLRIELKKQKSQGKEYTGGGIISKEAFRYGYYEARFRVPPGSGWHTSFWMMWHDDSGGTNPEKAKQEIDVCEQDSVNVSAYNSGVNDWTPKNAGGKVGYLYKKKTKTPDLSADFHIWACEFTPEKVKFFFDGKLTKEGDATVFQHGDQHIWLTSIASHLGGTKFVDDSRLPGAAEFDYVRFFKLP